MTGALTLIVTGATGFVGGHVVAAALARGHRVIAVGRDWTKAAPALRAGAAQCVTLDLHDPNQDPWAAIGPADAMIHLAWPGLANFRDPAHVAAHLPGDLRFLERMLANGLGQVLATGTCLEYGLREGRLSEDLPAEPILAYPTAKDRLRRALEPRAAEAGAALQWARLFYMFGPGQNPKSLLAQLDAAIDAGHDRFPMSGGEQSRDYLPVERVAELLVRLAERPRARGVFNVCSGRPISVRELVARRIRERGARITPDLGRFPYPDYEPMAFWGDTARLAAALG